MTFENYYWGMHLIWWLIWASLLFWIFALPYNIPGQRWRKESPMDTLQRRLASGEISNEEFDEKKRILNGDIPDYSKTPLYRF